MGVPKGDNGRCSLSLDDLKTPRASADYVLDGKVINMTHEEALERMFEAGKERFGFPDDFVQNILLLAQHKDAVIAEVLIPGSAELKALEPRAKLLAERFASTFAGVKQLKTDMPGDKKLNELYDNLCELRRDLKKLVENLAAGKTEVNVNGVMMALDQRMGVIQQVFEKLNNSYREEHWVVDV